MHATVAKARLTSLILERFKSYEQPTTVEFSPLTIVIGRNNSGKSSIIQALLLLKQTLALPRKDVPLHLEGMVEAFSLRELTFGWPLQEPYVLGPRLTVEWQSLLDINHALKRIGRPDRYTIADVAEVPWLVTATGMQNLTTSLELAYAEIDGRTALTEAILSSKDTSSGGVIGRFTFRRKDDGAYESFWRGRRSRFLLAEVDHFIPYVTIDRRNLGPRSRERSWHGAFEVIFGEAIDDLRRLLAGLSYLGSMRTPPQSLYKVATVPPTDIGVSGEYAAQLLHARKLETVHYLPALEIAADKLHIDHSVQSKPLVDAVNESLNSLGITGALDIKDIKDVGFQLLFGSASLQHVGRGLSYLLPVVELGLVADPLRYVAGEGVQTLEEYCAACPDVAHCIVEEPEAHLHPKVQSRLAHWFVSQAMAMRQFIVETHSDHLVRRLRGLVARAAPGSELESWMLNNVRLVEVEQPDGSSNLRVTRLTTEGAFEQWPEDFMDEATNEERSIYDASLDKEEERPLMPTGDSIQQDIGDEPDIES